MSASINAVLAQLKSDIAENLVPASANVVYDYRTFPDKLDVSISLSYQGGLPSGRTVDGDFLYYDVVAAVGAQIDEQATETALRNADQALNAVENALHALLGKGGDSNRNSLWRNIEFVSPSARPPQFPEVPNTRYAEIPFRVHLR